MTSNLPLLCRLTLKTFLNRYAELLFVGVNTPSEEKEIQTIRDALRDAAVSQRIHQHELDAAWQLIEKEWREKRCLR